MLKCNHLIAGAAVIGALAVAAPVAGANAAQPAAPVSSGSAPGASIPCYPFPAFCDPSTRQPASWAPWWVWPALGLQPPPLFSPIPVPPPNATPLS